MQDNPLIEGEVVFVLTLSGPLSPSDISNVSFQYGTDLSEPRIPGGPPPPGGGVPEPAAVLLLGTGVAIALRRLRAERA